MYYVLIAYILLVVVHVSMLIPMVRHDFNKFGHITIGAAIGLTAFTLIPILGTYAIGSIWYEEIGHKFFDKPLITKK